MSEDVFHITAQYVGVSWRIFIRKRSKQFREYQITGCLVRKLVDSGTDLPTNEQVHTAETQDNRQDDEADRPRRHAYFVVEEDVGVEKLLVDNKWVLIINYRRCFGSLTTPGVIHRREVVLELGLRLFGSQFPGFDAVVEDSDGGEVDDDREKEVSVGGALECEDTEKRRTRKRTAMKDINKWNTFSGIFDS